MTKNKNSIKNDEKTIKPAKKQAEKKTLYEAVQDSKVPTYIIIGALSKAGLLKQYREEKAVYNIENIEPSITDDELNQIIKKF